MKWQPTPVFLPGESQGRGSLVGFRLWGRTEWDMTEAAAAAFLSFQPTIFPSCCFYFVLGIADLLLFSVSTFSETPHHVYPACLQSIEFSRPWGSFAKL